MILILTQEDDEHTEAVCNVLKRKGAQFYCFRTADFPQRLNITMNFHFDGDSRFLTDGNSRIDLREVHSVWYRRPLPPIPHEHLHEADAAFVNLESVHLINSVYRLLSGAFWVNSQMSLFEANSKPYQLEIAKNLQFRIPRTLITNDPSEVIRFYDECGGKVIYKCFFSHGRIVDGRSKAIFTTSLRRHDIENNLDRICLAPCTFQEHISKRVELRVTVIGQAIFAAEINSQTYEHTRTDWRIPAPHPSLGEINYTMVLLGDELKERIRRLMRELKLVYGAIDLIVTPEGDIVFLEINPNGQWYRIEEVTGAPMAEAFAEILVQGTSQVSMNPELVEFS